jgi:serine protease Do|tara:strand:+ start:1528 stop:2496 length:969 start_codon:yes stop_codon:yes gene_type:complete
MKSVFLILLSVIIFLEIDADVVETEAWRKKVPENKKDLYAIQHRLQELLPKAKKGLVAIEANDGAGSGVIISPEGLILTAAHVIGKTGKKMKVRFANGKRASAISLGGSELSDAGMLKIIDEGPWPFVDMAKNQSSEIGDWCFGLGHPGGFDAKRGIVVRIGRIIGKKDETMQTDSRLLGGDSGGPLFDFQGKVIAIHSRISQKPDQNFHVPIESFQANWDFFKNQDLLTFNEIEKGGFLGVACEEEEDGLLVKSIVPNSAAAEAGLQAGDVLVKIDDQWVNNREKLTILISSKKPNEEVSIEYKRENTTNRIQLKLGIRSN